MSLPLDSLRPARLHGLDTLRAVAIVVVMVFHLAGYLPAALAPVADLGWMGVDLFFVLSGVLIGTQLLQPCARGERVDVAAFYARRAYRILPAYFVVLALYLAVPAWREQVLLPAAWKFITFTTNLVMNYPAELAFSHAWSLCVEEHFYLVLPWLVVWCMRRPSMRKTVTLLAGLVVLGVAVRGWELFHVVRAPGLSDDQAWPLFMKRIYYPTYSRLDGLLMGVALACVHVFRPAWWARVSRRGWEMLAAGLAVSGVAVWLFQDGYPSLDRTWGVLVGFPVLSLGLALLVAAAVCENGFLRRRVPGAKMVATLAFGLYLTHKEVAHVDRQLLPWMEKPSWSAAAVYAVTCFAVAGVLYLGVERPFLRLRARRMGQPKAAMAVEVQMDPAL